MLYVCMHVVVARVRALSSCSDAAADVWRNVTAQAPWTSASSVRTYVCMSVVCYMLYAVCLLCVCISMFRFYASYRAGNLSILIKNRFKRFGPQD